jgi:hypothetical protein
MQRAGIFVGVKRTGNLPELKDAVESARRMHKWAVTQGMVDGESAVLATDETDPVTPDALSEAVERMINYTQPEQLVIYFAGHGVTLRRGEQWLLSKAPGNPNHAVDLSWSIDAARGVRGGAGRRPPRRVAVPQVRGQAGTLTVSSARGRSRDR